MELEKKKCIPVYKGAFPLNARNVVLLIREIPQGWKNLNYRALKKSFPFPNFKESFEFARKLANIADMEKHIPNICINRRQVDVELSTPQAGGLTENDFIMAAKIERIY